VGQKAAEFEDLALDKLLSQEFIIILSASEQHATLHPALTALQFSSGLVSQRLPELLPSASVEFKTVKTFIDSALSSSLTISEVTCGQTTMSAMLRLTS